jgi:hypothetical protein
MAQSTIEFHWQRDNLGFEITESPLYIGGEPFLKGMRIIRRGGQLIDTQPLKNDRLFIAFSAIREPNELLRFVSSYGPLTLGGLRYDNDECQIRVFEMGGNDGSTNEEAVIPIIYHMGDSVDEMLKEAAWFRHAIDRHKAHDAALPTILNEHLQDIFVGVAAGWQGNNIRLTVRPGSLLDALKLQLVQSLAGITWSNCPECGKLFATGGRGQGRSYSNAKFCDVKCRKAAARKRGQK